MRECEIIVLLYVHISVVRIISINPDLKKCERESTTINKINKEEWCTYLNKDMKCDQIMSLSDN